MPQQSSAPSHSFAGQPGAGVLEQLVPPAVKPRLRGWLHMVTFPLALVGGVVLTALAPTERARVSIAVFTLTAALLFGTSAFYHRGDWSSTVHARLRRVDHANIFLLIAGTYTPLAVILLREHSATALLTLVWVGAALGVAFRLLWIDAPRWLYVPVYLAMGLSATIWLPAFARSGGEAVAVLVVLGGIAYVLGALAYGFRRPDPAPAWFGFHEVFHTGTVLGFGCHVAAIAVAAWVTA